MIKLSIVNKSGTILKSCEDENNISLVYNNAYSNGDRILLTSDLENQYMIISLDDAIGDSFIYFTNGLFEFSIPFEENKVCYSPKSFSGDLHLLTARYATPYEINSYKNLCLNKYDTHTNHSCFPHASANVETRGESVFAAKNAINGNKENHSHGHWPYESWGINKDPNACFRIDFGRTILADKITIVIRADFPHDAWWEKVTLVLSNQVKIELNLQKTDQPQTFNIPQQEIEWLELKELIKSDDPSPFPALSQIELYGVNQ